MSGVLDATHPFDRRSRDQLERPSSRKWSLHPGTIGAWVAEMDFGTAPVVTEALHRAIQDETLGYLSPATAAAMEPPPPAGCGASTAGTSTPSACTR